MPQVLGMVSEPQGSCPLKPSPSPEPAGGGNCFVSQAWLCHLVPGGQCLAGTHLSVSWPRSMAGSRSRPSITLSLGGASPARARLVVKRSMILPSWWLT